MATTQPKQRSAVRVTKPSRNTARLIVPNNTSNESSAHSRQSHNSHDGERNNETNQPLSPPPPQDPSQLYIIWRDVAFFRFFILSAVFTVFAYFCVSIRLHAVRTYGKVIHEFDPWFNFRATQYYHEHGWEAFSTWFDTKSWYPLGRPVGTTVYPGMMVTASKLHYVLNNYFDYEISLNDVCVFIPALFAPIASLFTMGIAYEATGQMTTAVIAFAIMAVLPAHTMRSVAGGFDNECVAVAALCCTFYFWVRSLRSSWSWWLGAITGLSYIYMVAAWGAYTFVLNMIGVHAACMLLLGHFTYGLVFSYSLFYVIGTYGAIQFPIVGMQPFQSMEQLGPLVVLLIMHVFLVVRLLLRAFNPNASKNVVYTTQVVVCIGAFIAMMLVGLVFLPEGFIGPLSARVRGLFVPHTRTGNPLVDSVAEHRATNPLYYVKYFHAMVIFAGVGCYRMVGKVLALPTESRTTAGHIFVSLFFLIALYFSSKMVRLLLLLAPAASITAAVSVRASIGWVAKVALAIPENVSNEDDAVSATSGNNAISSTQKEAERKKQRLLKLRNQGFQQPGAQVVTSSSGNITTVPAGKGSGSNLFAEIIQPIEKEAAQSPGMRMWVGLGVTFMLGQFLFFFVIHSSKMAQALSEPQIITRRSTNDGGMEILDDFREAYWWLRDETPEDSRVLAWWDYGYQINGIGNRTTLADGNTWNHEHIALIGRVLVSNEEHAYDIAKHLADYVLVWSTSFAGMRGDDLAKMPHMARIAGSVFDDINGAGYYLQGQDNPSPLMGESLLYKLHSAGIKDDVPMPTLFEEAYTSKNQMVRIWKVLDPSKESKEFCKFYHRYPPALSDVLAKKQDFKQIHGIFSSN